MIVEGHSIGKIRGFALQADTTGGPDHQIIMRAGRKALLQEIPRRVRLFQEAPDSALSLDTETGLLSWEGIALGKLIAGKTFLQPAVRLFSGEFSDTNQRNQVENRLLRYVRTMIERDMAILFKAEQAVTNQPDLRGIVHRLHEDGGITSLLSTDRMLPQQAKRSLRKIGVEVGRFAIFFPALLRPRPLGLMTLLTQLRLGESLAIPAPGRVSLPWDLVAGVPGWLQAGQTGIRLDIAERSVAELEHLTRKQDHPAPAGLASRFGVKTDMVPGILTALGIAHRPPSAASPSHAGPPAPLMILSDRRTRAGRRRPKASGQRTSRPTAVRQDSPFAALAILRERSTP